MPTDRPKKLLDQVREAIRRDHYSIHTEEAYVDFHKTAQATNVSLAVM